MIANRRVIIVTLMLVLLSLRIIETRIARLIVIVLISHRSRLCSVLCQVLDKAVVNRQARGVRNPLLLYLLRIRTENRQTIFNTTRQGTPKKHFSTSTYTIEEPKIKPICSRIDRRYRGSTGQKSRYFIEATVSD